ncbi:MAG: hypothetical protein KDK23_11510 [Leptospiraceae bacterium]|nr:hypothetical protein [Leptospiraceae bacterium]
MADEELQESAYEPEPVEPDPALMVDPSAELDDDFEETTLTRTQKFWIALTITVSFIFFSIVFFPLEILIRSNLQDPAQGFQADFTSLDLNAFGADEIQDFQFRAGGFSISSPKVESSISWFGLMKQDLRGTVRMPESLTITAGDTLLSGKQAQLNLSLPGGLELPVASWNGSIELQLMDFRFSSLPSGIPLPIAASDLEIKEGSLKLGFSAGGVSFEGSRIQTNLFNIRLLGGGTVRGNLATMQLKGRICLQPVSDLQDKNPAIYDFYTAFGGAGGGELCFKLEGNLANPRFLPEQQQLSENPPAPDPAAREAQENPEENPNEEGSPDTGEQESSEEL